MLATYLHSHGSLYFTSTEVQLPDNINYEMLQAAWSNVVAKYDMLRTGFTNVNHPKYPFAMITYHKGVFESTLNFWQESSSNNADTLLERTRAVSFAVLNSLHLPPWRIEIIKQNSSGPIARLFLHHALFDAVCLRIILDDFSKHYYESALAPEIAIDPLLNLILSQSGSDMESKETFWKSYLKDVPTTKFPNTNVLQTQSQKTNSMQKSCEMSLAEIKRNCQILGVAIQSVCQAAWVRILSNYEGESVVKFGLGVFH